MRSNIENVSQSIDKSSEITRLLHLLFRQNNVDLDYETRRFNDAYTSGWELGRPRNAGVIRIIDDSFPAYDREGPPFGRDRIGSSFACHVTHRFVIAWNYRSRLNWQFARPEKHYFGQLKRQIEEDAFRKRTGSTLHELSRILIISHCKCF